MIHRTKPLRKPIILVHGGAGRLRSKQLREYKLCLKDAVENGFKALVTGSAIDGVVEAVKTMENCGFMNAGIGSVLNIYREVEMDAGIMDGSTLRVGGVALVKRIKNPILLAKMVMEKTDHILLAGSFAEDLGIKLGLETWNFKRHPQYADKIRKYNELYSRLLEGKIKHLRRLRKLLEKMNETHFETVGAVALDKEGKLAAATSTGGYWLKLPGRIGDTPVVGAGFYANHIAAASASGIGEYILITGLCRRAVELVEGGLSAFEAASKSIAYITNIFGENTAGLIIVDAHGYVGYAFNTEGMGRALLSGSHREAKVAVFKYEPLI